MRVLFVGGGSGGHINPALAIAGYLREKRADAEILYIGAKGAMEERLVPIAGYRLETIRVSGFQRKLSLQNIKRNAQAVVRMVTSSREARSIIKGFAPDVCVGTGGFVSGPVIREATKLGIPCVIHESNAYPGLTTKILSKQVDVVMIAVEEAKQYFDPGVKCMLTGNPVRRELTLASQAKSRRELQLDDRPMVLSFGGSLGAQAINRAAIGMLKESSKYKKYQHIHGYGKHDSGFLKAVKASGLNLQSNPQIKLVEYIDNMSLCLSAADLVISRAGAITLTEIESKSKASILIPSPNVAENHQFHNAMALVKRDAARLIEEKNLTGASLWSEMDSVLTNPQKLQEIGQNAGKMIIQDTNEMIYRIIVTAMKRRG